MCRSSRTPPPPRRGPFWGRGGVPSAPGGRRVAPLTPKLGGGSGGGGVGGPPPRLPAPSGVGLPSVVSGLPPPGYTRAVGGAGRPRASGAVRSAANGSVRRGGGGGPLPRIAPPSYRGRSVCAVLGAASPPSAGSGQGMRAPASAVVPPHPWVQRPLRGGCGAAVSSVCLSPLLGLRGRGGGEWGGGSGPLAPPRDGQGGTAWRSRPRGPAVGWGSHSSPAPLYLESDPRAGPRWGPSSPPPSSRGAGRPGAAVRVSGQRLAGCGAVGSPPRSLSPPSLPRKVARATSSRRTVGGALVGGPSSPPHSLASAVWVVTCAAACVGAGAVAAAGCAGGSASGRGRCARPGGASCLRPHP